MKTLSKEQQEIERKIRQERIDEWSKHYPLAAEVMFGVDKGKLERIERFLKCNS